MSAFESIRCVTFTIFDLVASKDAFVKFLSYRSVHEGSVSQQQADLWHSPSSTGLPCCLLQPASGENVFIRLIEARSPPAYAPLKHYGWNAAELHVQDVYSLAKRLEDSPFRIIGGPRDLLDNDAVVAMQVLGPGNELLYLTQISDVGMQATYGKAETDVGRVFIAVLGSSNLLASCEFYGKLTEQLTQARALNIRALANAHGLDPLGSHFEISSAVFSQPFRIEMDSYPASATPKPCLKGALPPGLSMLTVTVPSTMAGQLDLLDPVLTGPDEPPYFGQTTGLILGPDGEHLEVIINNPA